MSEETAQETYLAPTEAARYLDISWVTWRLLREQEELIPATIRVSDGARMYKKSDLDGIIQRYKR